MNDYNFRNGIGALAQYRISEYFGLFDMNRLEDRLIHLRHGAKLYLSRGLSFHQFQSFHLNKQRFYNYVSIVIYSIFIASAIFFYFAGAPLFIAILLSISGLVINRLFVNSSIKANILHVNKLMADPYGLNNLKALIQIDVNNEIEMNKFSERLKWDNSTNYALIIEPDSLGNADLNSDVIYRQQLTRLSLLQNNFNSMPMDKVISFFSILCCGPCNKIIPQLSRQDFLKFIENAFIKQSEQLSLQLSERKLMITYQIFHQYYTTCYNQLYVNKGGNIEDYIQLLTNNFQGFDPNKVRNNFRTNDNRVLDDVREKYKKELHLLQPVQNTPT